MYEDVIGLKSKDVLCNHFIYVRLFTVLGFYENIKLYVCKNAIKGIMMHVGFINKFTIIHIYVLDEI